MGGQCDTSSHPCSPSFFFLQRCASTSKSRDFQWIRIQFSFISIKKPSKIHKTPNWRVLCAVWISSCAQNKEIQPCPSCPLFSGLGARSSSHSSCLRSAFISLETTCPGRYSEFPSPYLPITKLCFFSDQRTTSTSLLQHPRDAERRVTGVLAPVQQANPPVIDAMKKKHFFK